MVDVSTSFNNPSCTFQINSLDDLEKDTDHGKEEDDVFNVDGKPEEGKGNPVTTTNPM